MYRHLLFSIFIICGFSAEAQKVEHITFNLYTDSLKKGFYNYISVDGRLSDGNWLPLDSSHLVFSASTGFFKGNDLFIDSTYRFDSVKIKVALRNNPSIWKETVIYIRKRGFDEPLKTAEEIMNEPPRRQRKGKQGQLVSLEDRSQGTRNF